MDFGVTEPVLNAALQPITEAEKRGEAFVNRRDLLRRNFAEHAPHPPLVDRSDVVDGRE